MICNGSFQGAEMIPLLLVPESEDRIHQSLEGPGDDHLPFPPCGVPHV
jgi:hypothetical protein